MAERLEPDWAEIARQDNRALQRSDDLISAPIDPRRQEELDHLNALRQPQRFPLTGDGLVTHRIIADGPFNGPDIGAELALARYRDWEHQQRRIDVATPDILERTLAYVRDRTEGIQQQQRQQGELLRPVQAAAENTETEAAHLRLKPILPRM